MTGVQAYPRRSVSSRAQPAAISSASGRVMLIAQRSYRTTQGCAARYSHPRLFPRRQGDRVADRVDRDANRALRARFDDVLGQYRQLRSGLGDLQRELAELRISA